MAMSRKQLQNLIYTFVFAVSVGRLWNVNSEKGTLCILHCLRSALVSLAFSFVQWFGLTPPLSTHPPHIVKCPLNILASICIQLRLQSNIVELQGEPILFHSYFGRYQQISSKSFSLNFFFRLKYFFSILLELKRKNVQNNLLWHKNLIFSCLKQKNKTKNLPNVHLVVYYVSIIARDLSSYILLGVFPSSFTVVPFLFTILMSKILLLLTKGYLSLIGWI